MRRSDTFRSNHIWIVEGPIDLLPTVHKLKMSKIKQATSIEFSVKVYSAPSISGKQLNLLKRSVEIDGKEKNELMIIPFFFFNANLLRICDIPPSAMGNRNFEMKFYFKTTAKFFDGEKLVYTLKNIWKEQTLIVRRGYRGINFKHPPLSNTPPFG